jgi:beta-lactamase regulating signal transducer with metallopeptidase domain
MDEAYSSGVRQQAMGIGTSLFLIAAGAILRYAVTDHISGVDLTTVGLILMIVGIVGLLISLFVLLVYNRRDTVVTRDRYVDPPPPPRY